MRKEYDFAGACRGPVVPAPKGKTRITIRPDDDVLGWFNAQVHGSGGGNYQTRLNNALRPSLTAPPSRSTRWSVASSARSSSSPALRGRVVANHGLHNEAL